MPMKLPLCALVLCLASCGYFSTHEEKQSTSSVTDQMKAMQATLLTEMGEGWPSETDCDGLLWSSLAKASGVPVDLNAAEYAPGVLHRRPKSVGPCWTPEQGDVGSKSTISRDMITGYLWGRWVEGDLAAVQRLHDYGKANGWQMGLPASQPEVFLSNGLPGGKNLLGIICRMLGNCPQVAVAYFPVLEDYAKHLQVLGILLYGEVTGPDLALVLDVTGGMLERLKTLAADHPRDALFQAALGVYTGNMTRAEDLILDPGYQCPSYVRPEVYCPTHRLFVLRTILKSLKP